VLRPDVALALAVRVTHAEIVERARLVFASDAGRAPPMSLRGGYDVDSYDPPTPFDPNVDVETDGYIDIYAFNAVPHLDPESWRHYLPRMFEYSLQRVDDVGNLAIEGLLYSLRPPDRDPPRLGSLSNEQEAVVVDFLDVLAFDDASAYQDFARQVLEEWWVPRPLYRPHRDAGR
jgi:hypothetical protein